MNVEAYFADPSPYQELTHEISSPFTALPRPLIEIIFKLLNKQEGAALRGCSNRFRQIGRDLVIQACIEQKQLQYINRYPQIDLAMKLMQSKLLDIRRIPPDEIFKTVQAMQKLQQELSSLVQEQSVKRQRSEVDHFLLHGY